MRFSLNTALNYQNHRSKVLVTLVGSKILCNYFISSNVISKLKPVAS
jgi:hypothetical protein